MGAWKALKRDAGSGAWKGLHREAGSGWKALEWESAFLFEDDFEDGTIGNCPVNWTCQNVNATNHFRIIAGKRAKITHAAAYETNQNNIRTIPSFSSNNDRIIHMKVIPQNSSDYTFLEIHNTNGHLLSGIFLALRRGDFDYYHGGWAELQDFVVGTEYNLKIYNIDFVNNQWDIDINGVNRGTNLPFSVNINTISKIVIVGGSMENCESEWDDITLEEV